MGGEGEVDREEREEGREVLDESLIHDRALCKELCEASCQEG